jgi:DNA-directed RNA polymerase subunit RPC12/RpoP
MTRIQRFFKTILPRAWADEMERESRAWTIRCAHCGAVRSVWDAGGVRWKASGAPRRWMRCAQCGDRNWHTIDRATEK